MKSPCQELQTLKSIVLLVTVNVMYDLPIGKILPRSSIHHYLEVVNTLLLTTPRLSSRI